MARLAVRDVIRSRVAGEREGSGGEFWTGESGSDDVIHDMVSKLWEISFFLQTNNRLNNCGNSVDRSLDKKKRKKPGIYIQIMVDNTNSQASQAGSRNPTKVLVSLEEDDEFEDFPIEGRLGR